MSSVSWAWESGEGNPPIGEPLSSALENVIIFWQTHCQRIGGVDIVYIQHRNETTWPQTGRGGLLRLNQLRWRMTRQTHRCFPGVLANFLCSWSAAAKLSYSWIESCEEAELAVAGRAPSAPGTRSPSTPGGLATLPRGRGSISSSSFHFCQSPLSTEEEINRKF